MTAAKPGHLEALDNLVRDTLGRVRTFKAANVVAYVPPSPSSRATVTVQLARKQADLEGRTSEIPPIPDVPVMWPGFGDFMIWGTLKPGDDVILGVPDRSIKAWLQRGRTVDPDAGPLFNVANAVAWPVRLSRAKGAIPAGGLFLGRTDGTALIKILEDGTAVLVDASASIVLGTPGQALPLV